MSIFENCGGNWRGGGVGKRVGEGGRDGLGRAWGVGVVVDGVGGAERRQSVWRNAVWVLNI